MSYFHNYHKCLYRNPLKQLFMSNLSNTFFILRRWLLKYKMIYDRSIPSSILSLPKQFWDSHHSLCTIFFPKFEGAIPTMYWDWPLETLLKMVHPESQERAFKLISQYYIQLIFHPLIFRHILSISSCMY